MRTNNTLVILFVLLMLAIVNQPATAQTVATPKDCLQATSVLDNWINCKLRELVMTRVDQRGVNKQVQSPSISESGGSIIDQTDAPDLLGFALNFAGTNTGGDDSKKSVNAITTSAYALYAAASQNDALDPTFYKKHSSLRNFSFTFGRESADEVAAGQKAATIAGFKVRLVNLRDATRESNNKELDKVAIQLQNATGDYAGIRESIIDFLYNELKPSMLAAPPTRTSFIINQLMNSGIFVPLAKGLTNRQHAEINKIINGKINSHVELTETNQRVIETIRRKPQLSFTYQSKLRPGTGDDEHRAGLLFDMGIPGRINFAINGTFDYKDSKTIGGDTRGGRFVTEAYYQPFAEKNIFGGKDPLLLSITGEGKWMTGKGPTYQAQGKLTFPLFDGVNLPLSVTWANRKDLIKESTVRGNFGITFDLAKALKGFKK